MSRSKNNPKDNECMKVDSFAIENTLVNKGYLIVSC